MINILLYIRELACEKPWKAAETVEATSVVVISEFVQLFRVVPNIL